MLLAGLMLLQAGCGAKQNSAPSVQVEVPIAWSASADFPLSGNPSLAQWWQRFHDPILATLVTRALAANTSVQAAQAALRQARALSAVSAAALWPMLDGSVSAQRSKSGSNSAVSRYTAGLDAGWELDIFGGNRSALAASEATARASAASLGEVQVSVAAEVALTYIALRDAQARLAIARDNLASQEETLEITRWRLQASLASGQADVSADHVRL